MLITYYLEGNARWWGLVGILPLLTVAMSGCPTYTLFGLKTNKGE